MTTRVPLPVFGSKGFLAPNEKDILKGVFDDINAAFGGNLNDALETPQGQLATSIAAALGFNNDSLLYLFNQVDPAFSEGRMQDAIARIYFLERTKAEPTVVTAFCNGATGTEIPTGALAKAIDGQIYACVSGGIIDTSGTISLSFAATVDGPRPCPANSLTTIYRTIPGWDSITNPLPGIVGRDVENAQDFEARRAASVAINARGGVQAIRANLLALPNVLDAYVTENPQNTAQIIGGVSIAKNSIYACVSGGNPDQIARAIWQKKMPGCNTVGASTVIVEDNDSGYAVPYPQYSIKYQVPNPLPVKFSVTLKNGPGVPASVAELVRAAIVSAFQGGDGGGRATIGSTLFASRFYAPVAKLGTWPQILSIFIGAGAGSPNSNDLNVNIDQVPTVDLNDISVTLV